MSLHTRIFVVLALSVALPCRGKTFTDTLTSRTGDRLILSYDVTQSDRQFTIRFTNAREKLGQSAKKKYKKLTEIVPMFFDRVGGYDDMTFDGITPEAFFIPPKVDYVKSDDGYFFLEDNPTITFTLQQETASPLLRIPIYLTHYKKKRHYEVLCLCGMIEIPLKHPTRSLTRQTGTEVISQTITSTSETEADNSDITEALGTVERVMGLLATADRLPFSENLTFEVNQLRMMRSKMRDAATLGRINEALDAYDAKKQELEEAVSASATAEQLRAEREAKLAAQAERARQDSIAADNKLQAEKDKKRNLWMIIGGAILAAGCFVGNQVFQHFRNLSNQRSMQEMQDRMVRQAESEAKRRAQSLAHNKIHQAKNAARNTAREALNGIKTKNTGAKNRPKTI